MPTYLVFCDVDETLIRRESMLDFLEFYLLRQYGTQGLARFERTCAALASMLASRQSGESIHRAYYQLYRGERASDVRLQAAAWYRERCAEGDLFIDSTVEALAEHRAAGAHVVLVSGSFAPLVAPIAKRIGARRILCSAPIEEDGYYTGAVQQPLIGETKREAVAQVLAEYPQIDPATCFAYGDHESDIPMLDCVGCPVVVGEDPELLEYLSRRAAEERSERRPL